MAGNADSTWTLKRQLQSMPFRLLLLAILLVLEKSLLNLFVDFASAQTAEGLGAFVRIAQHLVFRFLVTFGVTVVLLAYMRAGNHWGRAFGPPLKTPISLRWGALHVLLVVVLVVLSRDLFTPQVLGLSFAALVLLWSVTAVGAVLAAFRAIAPWATWQRAAVGLGSVWVYALVAGVSAAAFMQWSEQLWEPTAHLTFYLVSKLLHPIIPGLVTDPTTLIMRTGRFAVQIAEVCSGLEGVGLMTVFCSAWLLFFRSEYRFPQALALVPIGLILVFLLNVVRIAAFVLIGDAGHPEVAIYGFHSQAGWIGFNLAAGAVVFFSRRVRWWQSRALTTEPKGDNPTAKYLMPLLAVIAAGIIARALSSGFEAWNGLRFIAGIVMLVVYRKRLLQLSWRFTWRALGTGFLGFVIWLIAAHWLLRPAPAPQELMVLTPLQHAGWIVARVATAVLIVPIVEELAFRAYLLRRLINSDFETVPYASVHWGAIAGSSVVFGISHGSMWLPAVVVGVLYAVLLCKTGRLGEAVAAHAVTNALLAAVVLSLGQWQLW
jgi:exosortase E/protease (VPEID-CTERM system)